MKPIIRVSSIDKLLRCHSSRPLTQNIVSVSGKIGNDGSYGHWQTGDILIKQHGAHAGSDFRKPDFPEGYEFPVKDSWIIDACIRNALSFVPEGWCMIVEDELAWEYPNFILVGHTDLIALCPDIRSCGVKDWKLGMVYQDPAEYNFQALGYTILSGKAWPTLDWWKMSLYQPRAFIGEDMERDSESMIVGRKEFDIAEKYLVHKIDQAIEQWYILNTGPKQCRWCEAWLRCPGIREEMKRMEMLITENDIKNAASEISNDNLGVLLHGAKILDPVIDDVTDEAKLRLSQGQAIEADGKRFVYEKKRWGSSVVDMPLFVDSIENLVEGDAEAMREISKITVSDARRAVAKVQKVPQKSTVDGKASAKSMIEDANEGNLVPDYREFITVEDIEPEAE